MKFFKKKDYEKIINNLDRECSDIRKENEKLTSINESMIKVLQYVKCNYDILDIVLTNVIDNEEGKETEFTKFNSVLDLANYLKNTNSASINSINEKICSIKNAINSNNIII